MMKRSLPALLVSALIGAAPAVAQPASIPAMRDGVAVQLRAEYVPANQFAAPAQNGPVGLVQPVDYGEAMQAAGYAADGSPLPGEAASDQTTHYAPQRGVPMAYQQPYDAPAGYAEVGNGNYPPPVAVVHSRQVVPVAYPVPVAYGAPVGWRGGWNRGWGRRGWNRGWNPGWNRGWGGGWNGGWGGGVVIQRGWGGGWNGNGPGWGQGWGGGWNRGGGWGCRSTGAGALAGSVAGAALGYGVASPWDRGTGVVIGGLVGALAGTALERSNRCY